jgi:2-dehydropantoate 2-reductase
VKVLVLGAGGIGGVVSGYLARCGHSVAVADPDEAHLSAIAEGGLRIEGQEDFAARPRAVPVPELGRWISTERPDVACIAVKAADTPAAVGLLADVPGLGGRLIVSLQNGWGSFEAAGLLGTDRVAAALMTFSAYKAGPGRVCYSGPGTFRLGMLTGEGSADLAAFAAALTAAFHPVELTDNIRGWLWAKAALSSFYYATALVSADVPQIIARHEYRPALTHLVGEVALVAETRGVRLETVDGFAPSVLRHEPWSSPAVAQCWAAHARFWAGRLQQRTGVWRDLAVHHRPTEIRGTEGRIIEWADAESVATPLLRRVVEMITEAEAGARELGWHNLDDLATVDARLSPDPPARSVP